MSAEETVGWLVQEVNDLLEASSVGLHEFLELLDEPDWPLSADEGRNIARRALETIVSSGGVDLRWMRWPESQSLGTVSIGDLPADPWRGPGEDSRYPAVQRV